jgi:hypothetical protein
MCSISRVRLFPFTPKRMNFWAEWRLMVDDWLVMLVIVLGACPGELFKLPNDVEPELELEDWTGENWRLRPVPLPSEVVLPRRGSVITFEIGNLAASYNLVRALFLHCLELKTCLHRCWP